MNPEYTAKKLKKKYDKKIVRKFNDMKDKFKNSDKIKGNPTLYEVFIEDFGTFEIALTVINPGTINNEFYMTKGHKHKKASKEIYVLVSGKGKLLIEGPTTKLIDMKKNIFYKIPKGYGHRAINTGNQKMEFLSFYAKNTGHDYKFKFKKRVFK